MDNEKRGNGLAVVIAFFMGGLAGAILSLLFAPLPGREAREKVRGASIDAKERTVDAAHRAKGRATEFVDQGKERIHEAKDSMKVAVEAGKQAFVEKKAEITDAILRQEEDAGESNEEVAS
jgi:gas vesicle protein